LHQLFPDNSKTILLFASIYDLLSKIEDFLPDRFYAFGAVSHICNCPSTCFTKKLTPKLHNSIEKKIHHL